MSVKRSATLEAREVSAGYGRRVVVDGVSLAVGAGECLGVIGPNGSGKSTLLRALSGVLPLLAGEVLLAGRPIAAYARREVARLLAGVPAELVSAFAFSARDIVAMGRHAYLPLLGDLGPEDERAIASALAATESGGFADRPFDELSSGERQRVVLAQALAQEPRVLLLDEPTAHLDLAHQTLLLDLLKRLQAERGLAIVLVSHDLNLAAEYADRLLLLERGRTRAAGTPEEVLDYRLIEEVYGTVVVVETNRISGRPRIVPVSRWSLEQARAGEASAGSPES
jgi:iron complex transport system ATP-binding protein